MGIGGIRWEDDVLIRVDERGAIGSISPPAADALDETVIDLRPWVVMPGLVDLHAHLPQLPNAGVGAGLDLLTWLERYIFPLERDFDVPTAELSRASRVSRLRAGGHHHRGRLRRPVGGEPGRLLPGCRGARHPGRDRQGDDGSAQL